MSTSRRFEEAILPQLVDDRRLIFAYPLASDAFPSSLRIGQDVTRPRSLRYSLPVLALALRCFGPWVFCFYLLSHLHDTRRCTVPGKVGAHCFSHFTTARKAFFCVFVNTRIFYDLGVDTLFLDTS